LDRWFVWLGVCVCMCLCVVYDLGLASCFACLGIFALFYYQWLILSASFLWEGWIHKTRGVHACRGLMEKNNDTPHTPPHTYTVGTVGAGEGETMAEPDAESLKRLMEQDFMRAERLEVCVCVCVFVGGVGGME
jgi:hypothetical protein